VGLQIHGCGCASDIIYNDTSTCTIAVLQCHVAQLHVARGGTCIGRSYDCKINLPAGTGIEKTVLRSQVAPRTRPARLAAEQRAPGTQTSSSRLVANAKWCQANKGQ